MRFKKLIMRFEKLVNFLFIFFVTLIVALTLAVTVFAGVFFYNYFTLTPDKILQSIKQTQHVVCEKHQALKTKITTQSNSIIVTEISGCDEILSTAVIGEGDGMNLEEESSDGSTSAANYSSEYVISYTKLLSDAIIMTEFLKESLEIYNTYDAEIAIIPDYIKVPNLQIANYLNIFKNSLYELNSEINKLDDQPTDDATPIKSSQNKITTAKIKLLGEVKSWTTLIYKNLKDNVHVDTRPESEMFVTLLAKIEKTECENRKQEALKNQKTIISNLHSQITRSTRTRSANDLAPTNFYSTNFDESIGEPNVGAIRFIWYPSVESGLPDKVTYKVYYRKGDGDGVTEIDAISESEVAQLEYSATSSVSPHQLSEIASYSDYESELLADGFEKNIWYTFVVQVNNEVGEQIGLSLPWTHYVHDRINIKIMDEGEHGVWVKMVMSGYINNDGNIQKILPIVSDISFLDKEHRDEVFFVVDPIETKSEIIGVNFDNSSLADADIINTSFSIPLFKDTLIEYDRMIETYGDGPIPLLIASGGNGQVACTEEIYNWAKNNEDKEIPHQTCTLLPAYIVENDRVLAKNLIIVGDRSGTGSKPGSFLKDHWITTYFTWSIPVSPNSAYSEIKPGTSFSSPYVTRIVAEIMNRAPSYTNKQIKDLIFSTAIDAGEEGVDEVYGHGILNPHAIFEELTKRGYYGKNLISTAPCN